MRKVSRGSVKISDFAKIFPGKNVQISGKIFMGSVNISDFNFSPFSDYWDCSWRTSVGTGPELPPFPRPPWEPLGGLPGPWTIWSPWWSPAGWSGGISPYAVGDSPWGCGARWFTCHGGTNGTSSSSSPWQ